ncbi:hypothetical protein L6164_033514 [Bauhinia variegata]|uniref:Uncharacterized protein n=1 Tax=Bauhinia variegata TaxID=167791 RepID=A0ACB9KRW3_BAUVA|nr:hypothetical protein L6164_033514 [Bauhinia variegata]
MRITNSSTDESALLALKASLNLNPDHVLSINWSGSFSFCNWVGVTCGIHHRRVRVLNLSDMGLSGTIHPQLGNLSFLVELDLHNNSFHGLLPCDSLRLRRLKRLNLSCNGFSGEIPNGIGRLSVLQHLSFRNNNFSGSIPPSISNLSVLQTLDWNVNLITRSIPPEIGQLRRLKILRIAFNKLS